ncbi:MAG: hypothetical protein AAFR76_01135 [Planctomycetota bacterium]
MRTLISVTRLLAAAFALPLLGGAPALAQASGQSPIEMSGRPFDLGSLGVSFNLPVGATATTRRIGTEVQADVIGPNNGYRVTITSRSSSNTELTAEAAAESILMNLKEAYGIEDGDATGVTIATFAQELRTVEPVSFPGGEAQRFFLQQPATASQDDTVRGVAVIDLGRGRMLVWDATSPIAGFETLAPSFDAMLSTIQFENPELRFADRGIAVTAGQRVLDSIDTDTLRETFESAGERWLRLYEPAGESDREIGYRRVTTWAGTRDEIDPSRRSSSSSTDMTPGLLVRIEARTLGEISPQTGNQIIYDSRGTYWVSEDLSSETWNLSIAIRDGGRTTSLSEVGARNGFEEIMVTAKTPSGRSETTRHRIEGEGYLPLPLALMLPDILTGAGTAGDFGFYAYRSDTNAIAYRSDSLRKDDDGEGWVLRSRVAPGTPELVKFLNDDGSIRREQLPDGKVWDPIESIELVNLWRRKRLPLD